MSEYRMAKGKHAEEALRYYFLSLGYYVVRGVPFSYHGIDITDVDLWLYLRSSSVSRERVCVDIKNKKTPQAIERVFWGKGLQQVLKLEKCIVATTDNRKETRDFGALHDVTVLSGDFVQRIIKKVSSIRERIEEEALLVALGAPCVTNSDINWRRYYRESKQNLLLKLNFDGCNYYFDRIRFLLEECLATSFSVPPLRLLYMHLSMFLVTLDYSTRNLAPYDIETIKQIIADGFRFGAAGKERADEIVNTALQILTSTKKEDLFSKSSIETEIKRQLEGYPAELLAEYFAKHDVMKLLFEFARECEKIAYLSTPPKTTEVSSQIKSLLGLLCDFFKIDRKAVI